MSMRFSLLLAKVQGGGLFKGDIIILDLQSRGCVFGKSPYEDNFYL
jgi:hypothetical protein